MNCVGSKPCLLEEVPWWLLAYSASVCYSKGNSHLLSNELFA